jgi:hypothetical protein
MGYYIRVLGTQDPDIHMDELMEGLISEGLSAKFAFDEGEEPGKWTVIDILNEEGDHLAQLERNPVLPGELGQDELDEFLEFIQEDKPISAVKWLTAYFNKVKVIYAIQMLDASFEEGNYEIVTNIKSTIWNKIGGILQADDEGFSNEDGYHILWQFADDVTGDWSCAVLNEKGEWERFVMDLGDKAQRKDFQEGKVPQKAKRI